MPVYVNDPQNDLMNAALEELQVTSETADAARAEVEQIVKNYLDNQEKAKALPGIGSARKRLIVWEQRLNALAKEFRSHLNVLLIGSATDNLQNTKEILDRDRETFEGLQSRLLAEADHLDDFAAMLRKRREQWQKNTGELDIHQMMHGSPERQLAIDCLGLFVQHRPGEETKTPDGAFHTFLTLVYEFATGLKLEEAELLSDARKAIDNYRSAR